jgi:hypothetical protein
MKAKLDKLVDQLDTGRTNEIFDSMIVRSKINDRSKELGEDAVKQARVVIGSGNLHINTARAKMSAIRMVGYTDGLVKTKLAVQRKIRNVRKYGGRSA